MEIELIQAKLVWLNEMKLVALADLDEVAATLERARFRVHHINGAIEITQELQKDLLAAEGATAQRAKEGETKEEKTDA